jgi:prepilin-type N-terminal cleavage/methylation domain-containing protein
MSARRKISKGFTLVEILIVVVILGILATIVLPQFTGATEDSELNTALAQLRTLRGQIALYDATYSDTFDPLTNQWDQLVANDLIFQAPRNPLQSADVVAAVAAAGVGWVWADLSGFGVDLYLVDSGGAVALNPDTGDPY